MTGPGPGGRVHLATGPTDMRKGFGGLYGAVKVRLEADPMSGQWFVFCNRRRTTLKVFYWDGSGFWVCAKRLERGCFGWPDQGRVSITYQELVCLLHGIEAGPRSYRRWWRRPVT